MNDTRNLRKSEDKKEEAKPGSDDSKTNSRRAKFGKWFLAAAGTAAIALGVACSDGSKDIYYPACPSCSDTCSDGGQETDSDMDASTDLDADTDADTELDAGPDLDADTDADTELDSGPDLDADTDVEEDAGIPDADVADADIADADVADADVEEDAGDSDSGSDSGLVCSSAMDGSISSEQVYFGSSVVVGGYSFTYVGEGSTGALIDITCDADSAVVETAYDCAIYSITPIAAPDKSIDIEVHAVSATKTRVSITVY
ncbi:hypothetical protein KKE92_06305 [Candidatus Micrarchaeota archaeon]|nr:hypothetical protein [Candidatus Micrarchaeota archaeon]